MGLSNSLQYNIRCVEFTDGDLVIVDDWKTL